MKSGHDHWMLFRYSILRYYLLLVGVALCVAGVQAQAAKVSSGNKVAPRENAQTGFFPGSINIFAGNGTIGGGYADGSLPANVSIGAPTAVAVDSQGDIFFAGDSGNTIYAVYEGNKVTPLIAAVTTQAATPVTPIKGDIYQVSAVSSNCSYCYTDGIPASQAYLNNIQGMSFDSSDNLFISAGLNMYCVFEVDSTTTDLHVVAGQFDLPSSYAVGDTIDGVPATSVTLSDPTDVKTDSFGNIYFTDEGNIVALVVYSGSQPPPVLAAEGVATTPSDQGNIYTIAGQVQNFCGGPGTCTDAGPGRGSLISGAISLFVDAAGDVYVLDNYAYTVRVIYAGAVVPALLATQKPVSGNIYTVVGLNTQFTPCSATPCGDGGTAQNIYLNNPSYVVVDSTGDVFIDDSFDHAIREVNAAGNVSTVAGIADPNATPPAIPAAGTTATSTPLNLPETIAFDAQENLYIADNGYNIVWSVAPSQPQTITFPKLDTPVTYGAGQVGLSATASSGLTVQYSVTGPALVSGTGPTAALNFTGAGLVTVTATQAGNAEFGPAPAVSQTLTVNKAPLTVTASDATKKFGQPNPVFTAAYSGFVNSDTQASSLTGQPSITTTATTNSAAGTYPLVVTQGTLTSANYSFTFVNGTFTITGSTAQTITFPAIPAITYGQATSITLGATASSGLAIQYTVVSGPGKVTGSTLTISGGGTIVITASQPGNNVYEGATAVTQSLVIKPAPLTVTAPTLTFPHGTAIDPTTFPAPTVTGFVGTDNSSLVSGAAVYTTSAVGTPAAGTYPLNVAQGTLSVVPQASGSYILANFVAGSIIIGKATQTISNLPLPALSYNAFYSVTASSSSGLPVTVSVTGPLVIQGSNMTAPSAGNNTIQFYSIGVGPASLTITQPGTADFAAAPPIVLTFNVNKAELDIQANNAIQEQGSQNPPFTYTIGANVQPGPLGGFVDIPSIVSGIPTLTTTATPSSPPGAYPIVPSAGTLTSPDYYFVFLNGTLTVTPPGGFVITANPSSLTIPTGMSGQATLTITPNNAYQGTVTLSCGQLPANVSCVVSPATYTFPGSQNADGSENPAQGTITISTAGTLVGLMPAKNSTILNASFLIPGAAAGLMLLLIRRRMARRGIVLGACVLTILSLGMISLTACGGSSGSGTKPVTGTTILTINGSGTTPSGAGTVTASAPLSVTIQ